MVTMDSVESTTYWEGKAPPSIVLGPFLSKIPSVVSVKPEGNKSRRGGGELGFGR
jgi:hypothetical protein